MLHDHWDQFTVLLQTALTAARQAGDRPGQAYALSQLGAVRRFTGDSPSAAASHQQALKIYRDGGYRLGEAEALNNLGELLTRSSASKSALDYHTQALAIARDISMPLEDARALEGIGRCHFQDGNPGQGGACLRQALTIYQHIGAPGAQRVQEALRERGL
jgi:tetratricopeptide (TPR) repeat protein